MLRVADLPEQPTDAPPGTVLEGFNVATARGAVQLLTVQAAGKKAMGIEEFARGHPMGQGDRLEALR